MRFIARATTFVRRVVDLGLLALIVVVLFAVILGKGAPLVGRQSIVIGGGSMEPAIPLGAAIVVAPVDPGSLTVGDVVSMQIGSDHSTYTHRIVDVVDRPDGRWIRTKGDANAEPDPTLVPASAIIGRVELTIPFVGYLLALLSLPVGVIFVLGLAATLLAIAWLLESLEPERVTVTTVTRTVSDPAVGASAADLAAARGEPIAARPARIGLPAGPTLTTAYAGSVLDPRRNAAPSASRPTVREQLERSRQTRNRRARWLRGRGDRPTAD
jgi:signal peptidase